MLNLQHKIDNEIKQKIDALELDKIVNRLVNLYKWPKSSAVLTKKQYKNFLFLKKKYGDSYLLPPSLEIDEFWHNHILYTQQYYQDCLFVFGKYLHHHPMDDTTENTSNMNLQRIFENETQQLHFQEFGEYLFETYPKLAKRNTKFFN